MHFAELKYLHVQQQEQDARPVEQVALIKLLKFHVFGI
jgi:hypothetical protein